MRLRYAIGLALIFLMPTIVSGMSTPSAGSPKMAYNYSYSSSGVHFANLATACGGGNNSPTPPNCAPQIPGSQIYCVDCQQTTTCSGGGSGAWAVLQGAGGWGCNVNGVQQANTSSLIGVTGSVQITGNSGNGTDFIKNVCINGICPVTAWNAKGNAVQDFDCSITGTTVVCSGATDPAFTSADVGKTAIFLHAGASNTGGQNSTLIAVINSFVSSTSVTLNSGATNNVASNGTFAYGSDDTIAFQTACSNIGPGLTLGIPPAKYILTGGLAVGNALTTQCEQLLAQNSTMIYGINNHTTNGITVTPPNVTGLGYLPVNFKGNLSIDMMNTGLDGITIAQGQPIHMNDITVSRAYRNGVSHIVTGSNWIQQEAWDHLLVRLSGLHQIYYDSNSATAGFIDNVDFHNVDTECPSLNGMQLVASNVTGTANDGGFVELTLAAPGTTGFTTGQQFTVIGVGGTTEANGIHTGTVVDGTHLLLGSVSFVHAYTSGGQVAPSAQLGADIYAISQGSSTSGLILQHTYGFPAEFNSCRKSGAGGATDFSSDININAIQFQDGQLPHVIEGAANGSAITGAFSAWTLTSPIIEDNTGGVQSPGSEISAEDTTIIPQGIHLLSHRYGGAYAAVTTNLFNTINCSSGCGNRTQAIGVSGNTAQDIVGYTEQVAGGLQVGTPTGGIPTPGSVNISGQYQINGTPIAGLSEQEWNLATSGTLGGLTTGTPALVCTKAVNAGHFTQLQASVALNGGTCSTAPTVNILDNTASTSGTALLSSAAGGTVTQAQTLSYAAGDQLCLEMATPAPSACASPFIGISAQMKEP